jgi:type IV secretory pathway VirB10-like protein
MRTQSRLPRRLAMVAGLSAVAAMGMITAGCAKEEEKAPETSTTTTTTTTTSPAAPPSETQKAPRIDPQAPNLFTPPVQAPPPSQVQGGEHGRHVTNGS